MSDLPPILFLVVSIITAVFWSLFSVWLSGNRKRIPGRIFEYMFFVFLFLASYFLTWAASGVLEGPQVISRLSFMMVCMISALFTGYFHYVKKMYN